MKRTLISHARRAVALLGAAGLVAVGGATLTAPAVWAAPTEEQFITFTNPGAFNFGTSPTLSATTSSMLTVAFSSSTPGVCTITSPGGVLTFLYAGTCTIDANQPGDETYLPAAQVSRSFTVNAVVPGPPVIGTATAGDTTASVAFTAGSNGGAAITGFTATANPGGLTGTCSTSPCTVDNLPNYTAYTFTVTATNSAGTGDPSNASNSVTPKATEAGPSITGTPPTATKGFEYEYGFAVDGVPASTVVVTAGRLPAGLQLSPSGALTGTPTRTGTFRFTVTATNSGGTASVRVTMKVRTPVRVAVVHSGGGTVTVTSAGRPPTACDSSCAPFVEAGKPVTLTAQPSSGGVFQGWGGACAAAGTDSTCTVTPTRNTRVLAAFDPD